MQGKWLSILEYANYKNKSISTVRRYVKKEKVLTKEENGKYYIFVENFEEKKLAKNNILEKIELLEAENIKLKSQLAEYQMLIELYEKGHFLNSSNTLPEIPELR